MGPTRFRTLEEIGNSINASLIANNNDPIEWNKDSLNTLREYNNGSYSQKIEMIANSTDPVVAQLARATTSPLDVPTIATRYEMFTQEAPLHEWLWWKHVYGMRNVNHGAGGDDGDDTCLSNPAYVRADTQCVEFCGKTNRVKYIKLWGGSYTKQWFDWTRDQRSHVEQAIVLYESSSAWNKFLFESILYMVCIFLLFFFVGWLRHPRPIPPQEFVLKWPSVDRMGIWE